MHYMSRYSLQEYGELSDDFRRKRMLLRDVPVEFIMHCNAKNIIRPIVFLFIKTFLLL